MFGLGRLFPAYGERLSEREPLKKVCMSNGPVVEPEDALKRVRSRASRGLCPRDAQRDSSFTDASWQACSRLFPDGGQRLEDFSLLQTRKSVFSRIFSHTPSGPGSMAGAFSLVGSSHEPPPVPRKHTGALLVASSGKSPILSFQLLSLPIIPVSTYGRQGRSLRFCWL